MGSKDYMNIKKLRYFIYARKSSESEDRQMASIDAQIVELASLATENNLFVVEVLSESKSAKEPGRPIFNKMLARISNGEADGIICWKLNRLARNPIDGGLISWMIQQGSIQHIQTFGRSYYPNDNVIMMAVELGMANQFIRDLSVDTKRGLRAMAERGWYPAGSKTLGYMHNPYKKKGEKEIIADPERFELTRKVFTTMLAGVHSPKKILEIATKEWGLIGRSGKKIALSTIYRILKDPFYYGEYEYPKRSNNWYKGNHPAMITVDEYDRIQVLLGKKGNPRPKLYDFAFRGPITCGECGALITAEKKVKRQKNGNVHFYTYYHCTKKKNPDCSQKSIEEKILEKQIAEVLGKIQLPKDFSEWAMEVLKENNVVEAESRKKILASQQKEYDRVLKMVDAIIEMRANGELTESEFAEKKASYSKEKSRLEMLLGDVGQRADDWLNQAEKYFDFATNARLVFEHGSVRVKKEILSTLGSNLSLKDGKLIVELPQILKVFEKASDKLKRLDVRFEPLENGSHKECLGQNDPQLITLLRG